MYDNDTQIPRKAQPHPDYVRTTRHYAKHALGLSIQQIIEFIQVDLELDWFAERPSRINHLPERYAALQTRYQELTAPKNTQN